MILVDPRVGSKHLVKPLRRLGLKVRRKRLAFGDVAFSGNGPSGTVLAGFELKNLDDLISSMLTKRLPTHQLPGLLKTYPRGFCWLIVQGEFRESADGMIEKEVWFHGSRRWFRHRTHLTYRALKGALFSHSICLPIRVEHTRDTDETAKFIARAYYALQKDWDDHKAHKSIVEEFPEIDIKDPWFDHERYFAEKVAALVPNVGLKKAPLVAKYFGNVVAMANASSRLWRRIRWRSKQGRKQSIGPKTAKGAWAIFRRRMPGSNGGAKGAKHSTSRMRSTSGGSSRRSQ